MRQLRQAERLQHDNLPAFDDGKLHAWYAPISHFTLQVAIDLIFDRLPFPGAAAAVAPRSMVKNKTAAVRMALLVLCMRRTFVYGVLEEESARV